MKTKKALLVAGLMATFPLVGCVSPYPYDEAVVVYSPTPIVVSTTPRVVYYYPVPYVHHHRPPPRYDGYNWGPGDGGGRRHITPPRGERHGGR